jgi:tetratricopeptide (TPR) repeat protein
MTTLRLFAGLVLCTLPAFADSPLESAIALYRAKDYAAAEPALAELVKTSPENGDAQFYYGLVSLKAGHVDVAIEHLERATLIAPTNSNYALELGGAYGKAAQKAGLLEKMSWAKKCVAMLEHAVELDPNNLAARNGLISYYREAPSFVGGGIAKAYEQAEELKKRNPVMGAIVFGQLYFSESRTADAFAAYDDGLKTAPDNYSLLYNFGRTAAQTGENLERGEAALKRCLTLQPAEGDPGYTAVNWRLGNIAEKRGDKAAAKAAYESALRDDPNFKPAAESLEKLSQ